jgi:hypothetical protein
LQDIVSLPLRFLPHLRPFDIFASQVLRRELDALFAACPPLPPSLQVTRFSLLLLSPHS